MIMTNNKHLYLPLKVSLGFLLFSELLVFLGPVDFRIQNQGLLLVYLIIVNIAFYLGYKRGVKRFRPSAAPIRLQTIEFLIVFGLVLHYVRLVEMWQTHGLSFSLETLFFAIFRPADVYFSEALESSQASSLTAYLSPITWASIPFGIYKWKQLPVFFKTLVVLTILIEVFSWLGIGTRKGLFDVIIIILFVIALRYKGFSSETKISKKYIIAVILLSATFVFYFVFSNLARYDLGINELDSFNYKYGTRPFYDEYCPNWLLVSLYNIDSYLCQGYYALSIGLSIGIISPTILGMSWFTMVIANKFGYDPMPGTYMTLLEQYGIDSKMNWHTIYLWLANDFTLIGVPIIIFFIGYFFAKTWCDGVHGKNDYAIPTFTLFLIMVFYFYANNQVLSFSLFAFLFWFIAYILTRKRIV